MLPHFGKTGTGDQADMARTNNRQLHETKTRRVNRMTARILPSIADFRRGKLQTPVDSRRRDVYWTDVDKIGEVVVKESKQP